MRRRHQSSPWAPEASRSLVGLSPVGGDATALGVGGPLQSDRAFQAGVPIPFRNVSSRLPSRSSSRRATRDESISFGTRCERPLQLRLDDLHISSRRGEHIGTKCAPDETVTRLGPRTGAMPVLRLPTTHRRHDGDECSICWCAVAERRKLGGARPPRPGAPRDEASSAFHGRPPYQRSSRSAASILRLAGDRGEVGERFTETCVRAGCDLTSTARVPAHMVMRESAARAASRRR